MKRILFIFMFIICSFGVYGACSFETPDECTNEGDCGNYNGTWFNSSCYNFRGRMISYYSFDVDYNDTMGLMDAQDGAGSPTHDTNVFALGGGSYFFDGNDCAKITAVPVNQMNDGNQGIGFWFKQDSVTAAYMLEKNEAGGTNGGFFARLPAATTFSGKFRHNDAYTGNPTINQGFTWHWLFMQFEDGAVSYWIDNELVDTRASVGVDDHSEDWKIACDNLDTGWYDGYIDELFFINDSLDQEERSVLWNAGDGLNPLTISPSLSFIDQTPVANSSISGDTDFNISLSNWLTAPNCSFYINDGLHETINSATNGNHFFNYSTTDGNEGSNDFNVTCFDGETTQSQEKTLFQDTVFPLIDYINWVQASDSQNFEFNGSTIDENFNLNISCTDSNLYYINITVTCSEEQIHYNFYQEDINNTNYIADAFVNIGTFNEEALNLTVVCADAHTQKEIPDFDLEQISGGLSFNGIQFYTEDSQLNTFTTTKETDRYTFNLSFNVPKKSIEIKVISPYEIKYIERYGSFITGEYWFDFKNIQGFSISNLVKTGNNEYSISLESETSVSTIKFESIGIINTKTEIVNFIVDIDDDTVNISSPNDELYNLSKINFTDIDVNFTYIPWYAPSAPDNCSLILNGETVDTDNSISKNVNNTFQYVLGFPDPQQSIIHNWSVSCNDTVFHPPSTFETHTHASETRIFTIINNDPTTTSTTTTTTTTSTTTTTLFGFGNSSLSCQYNPNPYIKEKVPFSERDLMKWICSFDTNTEKRCYTYVSRNGVIIQSNPDREKIQLTGMNDYFQGDSIVSVYFNSRDLVPNFDYNFSIICSDSNTTYQVTVPVVPIDKPIQDTVIPRALWVQSGITALILVILLLIIVFVVYKVVLKK